MPSSKVLTQRRCPQLKILPMPPPWKVTGSFRCSRVQPQLQPNRRKRRKFLRKASTSTLRRSMRSWSRVWRLRRPSPKAKAKLIKRTRRMMTTRWPSTVAVTMKNNRAFGKNNNKQKHSSSTNSNKLRKQRRSNSHNKTRHLRNSNKRMLSSQVQLLATHPPLQMERQLLPSRQLVAAKAIGTIIEVAWVVKEN